MGLKRAMMIGLDGADPLVVKRLINEGRLPNLKKVLEQGVQTEDMRLIGAYPSVTPPNWASLATGNWPRTHGVTDFFNQTLGKPLNTCELNWDSRRVNSEFIWEAFSREGKKSIMLNYCEAWPPRVKDDPNTVIVDGTGVIPFIKSELDAPKFIVMKEGDEPTKVVPHIKKKSASDCIISREMYEDMAAAEGNTAEGLDENAEYDAYEDQPLVEFPFPIFAPEVDMGTPGHDECDQIFTSISDPENWSFDLPEGAKMAVVPLGANTVRRYFIITASDGKTYDTVTVYKNKRSEKPMGTAKVGEWSGTIYDTFINNDEPVRVGYQLRVIEIAPDASSAKMIISHAMDFEDLSYFYPQETGRRLLDDIGPMMPHIKLDALGAPEVEMETWEQIFDWHARATHWLFKDNPNWQLFYVHLHGIDIYNHWYINKTLPGWTKDYKKYQEMLAHMYEINDKYVGEMLKYLDGNTNIIITSDHAGIPNSPGDENPGIGFLAGIATKVMQDLGYTVLKEGSIEAGKPEIDWSKTTAISARLSHIYLNIKGRDPEGIVDPEDVPALIDKIIGDLYSYRHPDTGKRVVAFCMTRPEMESIGMGGPHCGDILMQLMPTYCETHGNCPTTEEHENYSLNNLCMMIGPGFKSGEFIRRVIRVTDVVPTLCYLCDNQVPSNCEGGVIWQALKGFTEERYTRTMKHVKTENQRYKRMGD
jgi:predicted AlkP superfamily phosphohydrolase/phosphomutase